MAPLSVLSCLRREPVPRNTLIPPISIVAPSIKAGIITCVPDWTSEILTTSLPVLGLVVVVASRIGKVVPDNSGYISLNIGINLSGHFKLVGTGCFSVIACIAAYSSSFVVFVDTLFNWLVTCCISSSMFTYEDGIIGDADGIIGDAEGIIGGADGIMGDAGGGIVVNSGGKGAKGNWFQ